MEKLTFIKEPLPSTTNGWGFAGASNKIRYVFSNGDIWVSGMAHYRHLKSEPYVQHKPNADRSWSGGLDAKIDIIGGFADIRNYYKKLGYTVLDGKG